MEIKKLKERVCQAIEANAQEIIDLGESIFAEPELGYKEFKTAEKVKKAFASLDLEYQDEIALTGVIATAKGKESKAKIAIMGEMDAVVAPGHRCADKETGAAHSCGHHVQTATLLGAAIGLIRSGVMSELSGDVAFMAVPAEEAVELEFRNQLIKDGKIAFLGGKQEFIRLGHFDDIDAMIMNHSMTGNKVTAGGPGGMGFVAKLIHYIGRESHAAAPFMGINALNAAKVGLTAVDAIRDTFKDDDGIRIHPIITKGGDLVNVVPADVRIETFVRGRNLPAIEDASFKVNRALKAGADALGAQVKIYDIPGYMFAFEQPRLKNIVHQNFADLIGEDRIEQGRGFTTDANDVSNLVPTVHATVGGIVGVGHSSNYEVADPQLSYIVASKMMAMSVVDLLADGAKEALAIREEFEAPMTKEQYLKEWGKLNI